MIWLDPADIEALTARKRWSAQCRALAALGVPFRTNAVGRPLVERSAVVNAKPAREPRKAEPNWEGVTSGTAA